MDWECFDMGNGGYVNSDNRVSYELNSYKIMETCCRNHMLAYILWILTGIGILYLFIQLYYKLDRIDEIDKTVQNIYSILDFNSTCENQ